MKASNIPPDPLFAGGAQDDVAGGSIALLRQPAVTYGVRVQSALPRLVEELGAARVLPVVTSSLTGNAEVQAALNNLRAPLPVFHGLKPHTPLDVVSALVDRILELEPDLVVVVGGGSATDAAKIATIAAAAGARDHEALLGLRAVPDARGAMQASQVSRRMPVVSVPTTLAAAEFGVIAGATDTATNTKHLYRAETLAPEYVIYDPWLARATPLELWLSTGIRALDHGIETVLSIDANPLTDTLALRGISLLRQGLTRTKADPAEVTARHLSQAGAWLSGCAIGRVRYGASHGLGHQLGAIAGVPHGMTSCVLLPAVLAYNESAGPERQRLIAEAMGYPDDTAASAVRQLIASLGLPTRMSQLGVARESLARVAESALGNAFVRANVRPIASAEDILVILEEAY